VQHNDALRWMRVAGGRRCPVAPSASDCPGAAMGLPAATSTPPSHRRCVRAMVPRRRHLVAAHTIARAYERRALGRRVHARRRCGAYVTSAARRTGRRPRGGADTSVDSTACRRAAPHRTTTDCSKLDSGNRPDRSTTPVPPINVVIDIGSVRHADVARAGASPTQRVGIPRWRVGTVQLRGCGFSSRVQN
jgi:hypothetical protein